MLGLYTGKLGVTAKEYFGTYVYRPFAPELGKKEKKWIVPTSIILGFLSFGLVQLICYAALSRKKVSLLTRHNEYHAVSKRVKFLIERLNRFPDNEKTKCELQREVKNRMAEIDMGASTKLLQDHLLCLKRMDGDKFFNEIGKEADEFLHSKDNQLRDYAVFKEPKNKPEPKERDFVQEAKDEVNLEVKSTRINGLKNKKLHCSTLCENFSEKNPSLFVTVYEVADAFEDLFKVAPEVFENKKENLKEAILKYFNTLITNSKHPLVVHSVNIAWWCYLLDQGDLKELENLLPQLSKPISNEISEETSEIILKEYLEIDKIREEILGDYLNLKK